MAGRFFETLETSLKEAIAYHRGKVTLKTRVWNLEPAPKLRPEDIQRVRKKLGISQGVLAAVLNVSVATVQSWEQGRRRPEGAARRLVEVLARHPEFLLRPARHRTAA